jgi:hypothetical protein
MIGSQSADVGLLGSARFENALGVDAGLGRFKLRRKLGLRGDRGPKATFSLPVLQASLTKHNATVQALADCR